MLVKYDRGQPKVEVNESNPSFDYLTGEKNKFINVKAIIKNEKTQWEEDFKVGSEILAEQHVKEVIQFYNDTLRPQELPREYIRLV